MSIDKTIEEKKEDMEKVKALLKSLNELENNIKAMDGVELQMMTNRDLSKLRSLNMRVTAKMDMEKEKMICELCDKMAIKREP